MERLKYEIPEAAIADMQESLPKLKKIVKLCKGSDIMRSIADTAKREIEVIERCERFNIWVTQRYITYEVGIYEMVQVHDTRYNPLYSEDLLKIHFPTGELFFGDNRDVEYFEAFYRELKEIEPDYEYEAAHELYYKPEKARAALAHYIATLEKYQAGAEKRLKEWKIRQAEAELKRLREGCK